MPKDDFEVREFLVTVIEDDFGCPFDDLTISEVDGWVKRYCKNSEGLFMPYRYECVIEALK